MCTSRRKHETLPLGVFEYADSKNCGNHDVIPLFPAQKFKMADRGPLRNRFLVLTRLFYADYYDIGVFTYVF